MRIKYIIMLSGLAVAFAAASLWVFISGGKNAKAVQTKFRLGGLMLTVTGMLSLTSCEGNLGGGVMCYDPVVPQYVQLTTSDNSSYVKAGDTIEVTITDSPYRSHSYKILIGNEDILQAGELGKENGSYKITIEPTEYKGNIDLAVYGLEDGKEIVLAYFSLRLD